MVYHHRSVTCPHCGMIAERTRTVDSEILKGSPFRICSQCNETYFDPEYKEIGLVYFEEKGYELSITSILTVLFLHLVFFITLCSSIKDGVVPAMLLAVGLFGILSIICDIGLVRKYKAFKNPKDFHLKQVDYIEGRSTQRSAALIESMKRLSNRNYLDALKSHGIEVPDYFYQRLKD